MLFQKIKKKYIFKFSNIYLGKSLVPMNHFIEKSTLLGNFGCVPFSGRNVFFLFKTICGPEILFKKNTYFVSNFKHLFGEVSCQKWINLVKIHRFLGNSRKCFPFSGRDVFSIYCSFLLISCHTICKIHICICHCLRLFIANKHQCNNNNIDAND